MEFGLFHEITIADPTRAEERKHFQALLDQVRVAEQVGFTSVWHVEHHFLKGFSHSSCNDVILGAYAAATSTMRIGYGVKLLPFGFSNHPIKAAEAVATLDLLSNGRVEFGTGRGFSRQELEAFGVDPFKARDEWQESLEMIVKCWEDEDFSWDSPSFQIPPRPIVPKPVQEPHPPLWMAAAGPDTHTVAGELGLGLLSFAIFVPLEELTRRIGLYREGLKNCTNPIGKAVNGRVAAFAHVYCGESDEEARETAGKASEWYIKQGMEWIGDMMRWMDSMSKDFGTYNYVKAMAGFDLANVTFEYLNANNLCIVGSPDTCREKVKHYQECGLDTLLCYHQAHGVPLDKVRQSIERFGREVIPAFQ